VSPHEGWNPYLNPKLEGVDDNQRFSPINRDRHSDYSGNEDSDESDHRIYNNKKSFPNKKPSSSNGGMEGRMQTLERDFRINQTNSTNKPIVQQFVRNNQELTSLSLKGWDTQSWLRFSDLAKRRKSMQYAFEGTACLTTSQRNMLIISINMETFRKNIRISESTTPPRKN
jgi:hypothetical protein